MFSLYCKRLWQYTTESNTTESERAATTERCTPVMSPDELCTFGSFLFLVSHRGLCSSGWKNVPAPRASPSPRGQVVQCSHMSQQDCGLWSLLAAGLGKAASALRSQLSAPAKKAVSASSCGHFPTMQFFLTSAKLGVFSEALTPPSDFPTLPSLTVKEEKGGKREWIH